MLAWAAVYRRTLQCFAVASESLLLLVFSVAVLGKLIIESLLFAKFSDCEI